MLKGANQNYSYFMVFEEILFSVGILSPLCNTYIYYWTSLMRQVNLNADK